MIFFTGDNHFGHKNIIKFCNRPYSDVHEMDSAMVLRWNKVVAPDDIVYHLGDLTLGNDAQIYLQHLNGNIKILGNRLHHDKRWLAKENFLWSKGRPVEILPPLVVLEIPPQSLDLEMGRDIPITLCHYEMSNWDRKHFGGWHLFGHDHRKDNLQDDFSLNVGVDAWDYAPVSLDQIYTIMEGRGWYNMWSYYD